MFNCDCANYHSFSICSHVVAVAEVNEKLNQVIEWYRKAKKMPSLTKLATSDMPKGRGHKGRRVPRKKRTKTPIATRVNLVDVDSAASEAATPSEFSSHISVPDQVSTGPEHLATPQPTFQHLFDLPSSTAITIPHTQSYPTVFSPFQNSYPPGPGPSFVHSSIPWWQASYVNHGHQTLQQFLSPEYSPMMPRPLPSTPHIAFYIRFLSGNISLCYGCRNKYSKKPPPPNNLCLQRNGVHTTRRSQCCAPDKVPLGQYILPS